MDKDIDDLLDGLERSMSSAVKANTTAKPAAEPEQPKTVDMKTPYKWYHGKLGRGETEDLFAGKPMGAFLVRDSTSSPGDFVLSVVENNKFSHYIIKDMKGSYEVGKLRFPDVPTIIEHYKRNRLDHTTLLYPIDYGVIATLQALYDYTSNDPDDLSFKKGDTLSLMEKYDDAWWRAQNEKGKKGMVPANYVKILPFAAPPVPTSTRPSTRPERSMSQSTASPPSSPVSGRLERSASIVPGMGAAPSPAAVAALRAAADSSSGGGNVLQRSHSIVSLQKIDIPNAAKSPILAMMPDGSPVLARVRATINLAPGPDQKDALACSVGDTIFVMRQEGSQWYGQNDSTGERGYFPSMAVEVLPMPQRRITNHPEAFFS